MSQELPPSGSPKAKGSRSPKISRFMNTLRRSPAILRKRLGSGTNSRKDAHHDKKRTDKPEKNEDPKFYVQYLGCKEVSTLRFRQCKDVVEHLFETSKTLSGKDAVKCNVCIRRKYIDIDIIVSKEHIQVAIHNIAYCAADMKHPKVFAFIAKDTTNSGLLHCYAFLCNKPENAQSMTLCLSKSFESAFVEWQLAKSRHDLKVNRKPAAQHKDTNNEAPRRVKHHQGN
uniref:Protein FAM43A-like n=1 Tax=Saccoglossus kowalevskii TaxID=10224 RepID=A0ABM0MYA8_SACKO|nr:PREDICTED: protein FAM43A-like [Saccoglossus kowalevskii]